MIDRFDENDDVRRLEPLATAAGRQGCAHLDAAPLPAEPAADELVCRRCLDEGLRWVHLRMCTACGNIACCESSIGNHADAHFRSSAHPVMRSVEPGEVWRWCYVDQLLG